MPSRDEEGVESECRVAGLLAWHLVSQVLNEAYLVANAATESGQPWQYLSSRKNSRQDLTYVIPPGEEMANAVPIIDIESDGNNNCAVESISNIIVTSTPQKLVDETVKPKTEQNLIGQGDEELEAHHNELSISTSMFINHLFDMSDVERVIICEDAETLQDSSQPNELLAQTMAKIMQSYVSTALSACDETRTTDLEKVGDISRSTNHSSFSLLADALPEDVARDVVFYVDDEEPSCSDRQYEITLEPTTSQRALEQIAKTETAKIQNMALYENAYMTMNRDYDQCLDDDGYPVLQDPKGMVLQEVELITASTSEDTYPIYDEPDQEKEEKVNKAFAATSAVSASSRRSTLVRRCRLQGARLLACLRGWWRRKTPGKRKESRVPGSMRGLCPLSPDARRRACSLLGQHNLTSPLPARAVGWKFNTVNETLVNSSHWKEYTFENKPEECGEY